MMHENHGRDDLGGVEKSPDVITDRRTTAIQSLERCAEDIADKYQSGFFPELKQIGLPGAWKYLIKDLRGCCPGFSDIEYGIALNQSFGPRSGEP